MRENTGGGNGTTFDLQGRLVLCEGDNRRVTRTSADGGIEVLMDRFEGKRLNRRERVHIGSSQALDHRVRSGREQPQLLDRCMRDTLAGTHELFALE